MKIGSLFDLFTDSRDLCALFEGVDTREQLVSRLERLKHNDPDHTLHIVEGLRISLNQMYNDTFEPTASIDDSDDSDLDDLTDDNADVDKLLSDIASETTQPTTPADAEKPNSSETPPVTNSQIVEPPPA